MKKISAKPIIMSALAALAFGTVTVGTTFALFTDKAETKIQVKAGKVDVTPSFEEFKLYSAEASSVASTTSVKDENEATYEIKEQTGKFKNGGEATISSTGEVKISKMTPGDKITYKATFANQSNVNIKTRFVLRAEKTEENLALLNALEIKVNYGGEELDLSKHYFYATEWVLVAPSTTDLGTAEISIYLPLKAGNEYQNLETAFTMAFEAVQGNANVENEPALSFSIDNKHGLLTDIITDGGLIVAEGTSAKVLRGAVDESALNGTELAIPEGVTEIGDYAFNDVKLLKVTTPSTLKHIGDYAFMSESSTYATGEMNTLVLNEGLESFGNRSFKAQPIQNVVLPSTLTDLGTGAFYQCSELTGPVTIPSGVTELNQTFAYCPSLTGVVLNEGLKVIGTDALRETAITNLDVPSTVVEFGPQCLRQTNSLTTINLKCTQTPKFANNTFTNATEKKINVKNADVFKELTGVEPSDTDVVKNQWNGCKITFHYAPEL